MCGENFNLEDDSKILEINSPKKQLGGPYKVVYKSIAERYAIVAIDWEGEPRLGIRWFWDALGNPLSRATPIWFVIPPSLSKGILSALPLDHAFSHKVDEFLAGKSISW